MENTVLLLLATIIGCIDAWEVCYYKKYYVYTSYYGSLYCPDSCCGYYTKRQCCYQMSGGTVAGAVIGGLIFLAVIVAIVICIVMKNKRGARGTVVAPQGQITTVAMVQNSVAHVPPGYQAGYNYSQPMYPMNSMQHPPPPPGQPAYPPPNPTSGINPAYPTAPPPAYPPGPSFPAQPGYESVPNGIPPKS